MVVHKINTIVWLVLSSGVLFGGLRPSMLRWRFRFLCAGLAAFTRIQAILYDTAHHRLRRALGERPEILGILVWPYIDARWTFNKRVKVIEQHFSSLDGPRRLLNFSAHRHVELSRFPDVNDQLSLVLDKPITAIREGQVSLSLLYGDRRIYTVAFSMGCDAGERVAYVGAIQGRADDDMMEIYKLLTKQLHGMRPRDFLIEALRICCGLMDVHSILFVADRYRHHRSSYFRPRNDLLTSYDDIWQDRGAVLRPDGFFGLDTGAPRRSLDSVPSNKRATYRKRYAMLDGISIQIGEKLLAITQTQESHFSESVAA